MVLDNETLLREDIRVNALRGLEASFSRDTAIITVLLPNIREQILDRIIAFIENLQMICPGATHQAGDHFCTSEGQPFKISLAPNIRYPEELTVTLYPARQPRTKVKAVRRRLKTDYGGYTHIVIAFSDGLEPNHDLLQLTAECVISIIYEWTYSRLLSIHRTANETITGRLYGRIREIHPDPGDMWIGFVHKGRCYYLIDPHRRETLLSKMSQAGREIGTEPLALAIVLIGMDLPFEKSATREAFSNCKPLRINIGTLPYAVSTPDLVTAEQIIYGTEEIVVIPITHLERTETFLVAFSPVATSEFWIAFFDRYKIDFASILKDETSSLSKIAKASKRFFPSRMSRVIGDTLGHTIATIIERQSQ
jgi:hypothetical protein